MASKSKSKFKTYFTLGIAKQSSGTLQISPGLDSHACLPEPRCSVESAGSIACCTGGNSDACTDQLCSVGFLHLCKTRQTNLLMDHVAWQDANAALDTVHQISRILDTGLDKETLSILIALIESGVNPEVSACLHLPALVSGH